MRDESLFNKISAHEYVQRVPLIVAQQMKDWPDDLFDTTDLDAKITSIKEQAKVTPVALQFEQRTGVRRSEKYSGDDGWGRRVERTVEIIDVSIPFEGDDVSFTISPSTKTLGTSGRVQGNNLIISLKDDENLEADLKAKLDVIASNLSRVASDLAHLPKAVAEAIDREVLQRRAANQARRDRDSRRSFPIA